MTTQKFLNETKIKFPQELVDRVNMNWLTKEHADEFEGLSDDLKCMEFAFISNREKREQGLAWDISTFAVNKLMANTHREAND